MLKNHVPASLVFPLAALLIVTACGGDPAIDSEPAARAVAPPIPESSLSYDPATARALSIQSMGMEDPAQAETALRRAIELSPNLVDAWLLMAGLKVRQGDVDGAFANLERVTELGVRAPVTAFAPLQPLQTDPRWADLVAKLEAHKEPAGSSDVLFTLEENDLLTEGVAYDAKSDAWFVSAVHARKIVRIGPDGTVSDWLADRDDVWGVFGIAVDSERGKLWATTASLGQMRGFDPAQGRQTALLEIDLTTAEVLARYELPARESAQQAEPVPGQGPQIRQLNDLTVAQDGTVYTTDTSPPGAVYRLVPDGSELQRIGESMLLNSPQGVALVADDSVLVVADYSLGLVALDLATGESWFVEPPADLWLQTLDGLSAVGDGTLVVIQNGGYPPHRILRLELSADHRSVTGWSIAAKALPEWREPTLGTVVDDGAGQKFVYVAASQWALFPEGQPPVVDQMGPPLIMSLDLKPVQATEPLP